MIIKKEVNLHWRKWDWDDGDAILVVSQYTYADDKDYQFIKTVEIEVDVPEFDQKTFDLGAVAALKEERKKVMAVSELALKEIDEKINKLLAIEFNEGE
jgi:hypothetical protein